MMKTTHTEKEHYLTAAQMYDTHVPAILPASDSFFSSCISFIPKNPITVLELGSGTGYATSLIRAWNSNAEITCIDHSWEMIQAARKKPELAGVSVLLQDIMDPWPELQYDLIISTLCLHHIPKDDRTVLLHRICTALGPDGVFICGDIIKPESASAEQVYRQRWIQAMKEAGMPPGEIEHILASREHNYSDMETVQAFVKKLNDSGFPVVLMPYRHELSAVFIGMKTESGMNGTNTAL